MLLHALDEFRIHRLAAEQPLGFCGDGAHDDALTVARIAAVGTRRLARERTHSGNHAAVVGVVIVRAEHVRLARVLVLDRDIKLLHAPLEKLGIVAARHAVRAVRRARKARVDGREIVERLPCLRLQKVADARAVSARRIAEDTARGAFPSESMLFALLFEPCRVREDVLAHEVFICALLLRCCKLHSLIDPADGVRHGIAEKTADARRHVDARPLELGERDDFKPDDALRRSLPDGAHAHEVEQLGDALSMTAHV